jgi:hypothetical protein
MANGYLNKNKTNSISMDAFNKNYFVAAWNVSTAENPNFSYLTPGVPDISSLRVRADFSTTTPIELSCLMFLQTSMTMTINEQRRVGLSYLDTLN